MNTTQPNNEPQKNPKAPGQNQNAQPNKTDTEINPGKRANNTEVDLDKSKVKTYPPERKTS